MVVLVQRFDFEAGASESDRNGRIIFRYFDGQRNRMLSLRCPDQVTLKLGNAYFTTRSDLVSAFVIEVNHQASSVQPCRRANEE